MKLKPNTPRIVCLMALVAGLLGSCGPVTPAVPTVTARLQPTTTPPATSSQSSLFQAGKIYSDASGDTDVGFLDVVGFRAEVHEETEMLDVVLHMRDVPEEAPRGQIIDFGEYMWDISVFLEPPAGEAGSAQPDVGFLVLTVTSSPSPGEGVQTPKPGTAEIVSIDQLWDVRSIYDAAGEYLGMLDVTASPEDDTLTFSGRVPGITSSAAFRFSTLHYEGSTDRPDNYVPSAEVPTPRPAVSEAPPTPAPGGADPALLTPAGAVRAYPGPAHYAGDVLTFEIRVEDGIELQPGPVRMSVDGQDPRELTGEALFDRLVLPLALDTTGLTGAHTVTFSSVDGALHKTYSLKVLPASERPANESTAEWTTREIACCRLHYITDTAAARDIEFITEHFEQAAEDFTAVTENEIDPKLDVYIIDTMWGNGGFGGNGELVISYSDRYYGPTIGGEGLEVLARHEFTHAANMGAVETGDGVEFNYEGLAVYVAGGHYKPEPLAERGAALYDLGEYVPVGQFLNQHELAYLYPAAMLTYIVETYGTDSMWEFLASDDNLDDDQPGSLSAALETTFGVSLQEFDRGFQAWLESKDPGEQLEDLRLTVELQDLRRQYQDTYAPPPGFLLAEAVDAAARPEYLPVVIREARAPGNVAAELIIREAQQAIVDGDYGRAEELNRVLETVVSTGAFEEPLAKEYLEIALAAAQAGYEIVSLDLQGNRASAQVTVEPPELVAVEFQNVDGVWQIQR